MIIKNCKVLYLDRIQASMKAIKETKLKGTEGAVFRKLVFGIILELRKATTALTQ